MFSKVFKFALAGILFVFFSSFLGATQWVKVAKNPEQGWRLLVDGEQIAVHGVVWSFVPIGENYSYNLWDQPKDIIQEMIDVDAVLMQEMGVNAIRVFADVPPEWISYLYNRYGIYSIVNPLMGRYGMMVDGRWHSKTNYADIRTREVILNDLQESIEPYVGVSGVLFYMLGNEGNYGLEWDSDEIENLPVGQRLEIRAGYLYSLLEEGIRIVKDTDPTKPVGIVNGDIQYLNLIEALVPSLDILGVNTYRGGAAYELFYESVAESLDLPIVFTEFGADAFNVIEEKEDQYNQALLIKDQWEEIYQQSYGKGGYQNVLGGFVFEWMDEWWKSGQILDLDVHNEDASWSNGAYEFDSAHNKNNMNEEWWGLVAQSTVKKNGIHERRPRAAYYVLKEIWKLNQINSTLEEIAEHFAMNIRSFVNQAEIMAMQQLDKEKFHARFRGQAKFVGVGSFSDVDVVEKNTSDNTIKSVGLDNISTSVGEWVYLGVDLSPMENLDAGISVRLQGHVPETTFDFEEYTHFTDSVNPDEVQHIEIYDAYLNWETRLADIDFYYHNGHSDWGVEGDYFHLLPESFDFLGMDIYESKAPFGLEVTGKGVLEGLTLYAGPEIYWNATPQIMGKYFRKGEKVSWSLMYSEPFSRVKPSEMKPLPVGRRASGWVGLNLLPWITLDLGLLFSGSGYLDDPYIDVTKDASGKYTTSKSAISVLDTLSGKVELTTEIFLYTKLFARYTYAGRVAASHAYSVLNGTQMVDVGTGNRHEVEAGFQFQYGMLSIMPKFLFRMPLSHPLSQAGLSPRKVLQEPVAVWDNREAYEMEVIVALDPTGDTYLFDWNNADRENAKLAGYVSFLYSFYRGPTDAFYFKNAVGGYYSQTAGLPEVRGLWSLKGRILWNAAPKLRFVLGLRGGSDQSRGENDRIVNFWGGNLTIRADKWIIDGSLDIDAWGHDDWMRELNITYPLQWTLDISRGFSIPSLLDTSNRVGVRWKGRTYNDNSNPEETAKGELWRMEIAAYLTFSW